MKKKIVAVLTLLVFSISILILPVQKASAFTVPNLALGTKIIRAVGEKIGVKWTSSSLAAVAGYIGGLYNSSGHEPLFPHWWFFGTTPDEIASDFNAGDYLISHDDFVNTAKQIKKASDVLVPDNTVSLYSKCFPVYGLSGNFSTLDFSKYSLVSYKRTSDSIPFLLFYENDTGVVSIDSYGRLTGQGLGHFYIFADAENWLDGIYEYQLDGVNGGSATIVSQIYDSFKFYPIGMCTYKVKTSDVPNITNISNTTINNIDNSVTNNNTTPPIPLKIDVNNTDPAVPLNPPLDDTDITIILKPPSLPSDGGGGGLPSTVDDDTHSILGYVKDTYDGLTTFMSSSVTMLTDLTQGTAGLVSFLGSFFSWLPPPFVSVMTVGFMIGVIGFWFRR